MPTPYNSSRTLAPSLLRAVAWASLLCCAGGAQAQASDSKADKAGSTSSVTLYGILDAGVTHISGLSGGSKTHVVSGIMEGTRFGLKGTEDLGGGYRALFNLEARIEADTGSISNRPASGSQLPDRYPSAAQAATLAPASVTGIPDPVYAALKSKAVIPALQQLITGLNSQIANEFGVNVGSYGNRLFDRQSYAGLVTPFGAVLVGRQYTPAFETNATYDIMGTQSALAAGQIVAFPAVLEIRTSNAVSYRIQADGFAASAMTAYGNDGELIGKQTRHHGVNASYTADRYSVGLAYNTQNNEQGKKSLTTAVVGAYAKFGAGTLSAMALSMKDDNPAGLSAIKGSLKALGDGVAPQLTALKLDPGLALTLAAQAEKAVSDAYTEAFKQDGRLLHIGYRHVFGVNTVSVAYNQFDDRRPANADVRSFGLAYTLALSKRTDLNAVLVRYDNSATSQVAPGGNGYIGGFTQSGGTDSTGLALGVRHRF
jgi:predicted porin